MQKAFDEIIEKVKVTSLEIIVTGTKDKPYFEIKYKEVGKEDYYIGYSSYDLNNVFEWKEECFELVEEKESEHNIHKAFKDIIERLEKKAEDFGIGIANGAKFVRLESAIEIVNKVAEEYKQEVCEWKKHKKYECTVEAHGGYEHIEFIRQCEYCPYCGKKIKVVE